MSAVSRQRRPDLDTVFTINADGSRNFLHLADVRGRWHRRKIALWWILLAIYVGMPLVRIGGRPFLLLDLPARVAYIAGRTFTNQDFYLVFFLITGMGFGLFVLTSLLGRVWCGYACPQTVFLEALFRPVERFFEGSREQRLRRQAGPASAGHTLRRTAKHLVFLLLAFGIAHVFLAYFIPLGRLLQVMRSGPSGHWVVFGWTVFWTGMIYFDNSWFREQTCLVVCPYGRLQSALLDADSVIIGYDAGRGEPRSPRADEGGDCIDCGRCIAVCPTGIDIRNGLQMECIGCANCIDACDEIMARTGKPAGLVRYDSKRGFAGERRRSIFRPRVALYAVLGLAGLSVFGLTARQREPFEVRVLRAAGLPYTLEAGEIRNLYTLHLQNKSPRDAEYLVRAVEEPAAGAAGAPHPHFIIAQDRVKIAALGDARVPIFAELSRAEYRAEFPIHLGVRDAAGGPERVVEVIFRGP